MLFLQQFEVLRMILSFIIVSSGRVSGYHSGFSRCAGTAPRLGRREWSMGGTTKRAASKTWPRIDEFAQISPLGWSIRAWVGCPLGRGAAACHSVLRSPLPRHHSFSSRSTCSLPELVKSPLGFLGWPVPRPRRAYLTSHDTRMTRCRPSSGRLADLQRRSIELKPMHVILPLRWGFHPAACMA